MIYILIIQVLITAVGAWFLIRRQRQRDAAGVVDSIAAFFLFSFVGISGVFAFLGHTFSADSVADSIGFPAGNPFQFEVAVANLACGVTGLMCIWFAGGFRWATAIFAAVFLWGASVGHIYEYAAHGNHSSGNIGPVVYIDILVPLIALGLLTAEEILRRRRPPVEIVTQEEEPARRAA